MADLQLLVDELTNDPLTRGYSGMTDSAATASLNAVDRTRSLPTMSGAAIYEAVDDTEFRALTAAEQQRVRDIWGLGDSIDITNGSKARAVILALFDAGTTTRTNLVAASRTAVSRGEEIGFGRVRVGNVIEARR